VELTFAFNLLGAIAVVVVFGLVGVLFLRRGRGGSPSDVVLDEKLIDPTAHQTLGQMAQHPGVLDERPGTNTDLGDRGDSGGG
jgi:hypothetical protein